MTTILGDPRRLAIYGLVGGAAVFAWPASSHATFPGENGRLVFAASCEVLQLNDRPSDCSHTGVSKLRAINPRTGERLPFNAGCPRRCDDLEPRFSPDGRRLAFNRLRRGEGRSRALVSDAAGAGARQIRRFGQSPSWSPNGKALAIGGQAGIRIFRPNGAFVRRVTRVPSYELDWSSGGRIVFARGGSTDLYTVSGRGGRLRRLTRCGCLNEAKWSPDGLKLTFYRFFRGTSRPDVFVMDADGSNRRRIARWATTPVWSPDGREIAYARPSRGIRDAQVLVARPDGSHRRVAYRIRAQVLPGIGDLAWQPRPRNRR